MPEFALIERLARAIPSRGPGVDLGIGDDAAVLAPEPGKRLAISSDTLNEGVHFLPGADPEALGHKALAVNLSDLAAMGAEPRWALLNLTLPEADADWLDAFARGFAGLATAHELALVGGDTTQGPLSLTVTVLGSLPAQGGLTRSGAGAGDRVFVSGTLGDAAYALGRRQAGVGDSAADLSGTDAALDRPSPRLALGQGLLRQATACIDVSDGLLADLGHVARASGLSAELELASLPGSETLLALPETQRWDLQLCGGDDYELCFTAPPERREAILALGEQLGLPLTEIGFMAATDGAASGAGGEATPAGHGLEPGGNVRCRRPDGSDYTPARPAWEHFSRPGLSGP